MQNLKEEMTVKKSIKGLTILVGMASEYLFGTINRGKNFKKLNSLNTDNLDNIKLISNKRL